MVMPALMVINRRVFPGMRDEFNAWVERGPREIESVLGQNRVAIQHFPPLYGGEKKEGGDAEACPMPDHHGQDHREANDVLVLAFATAEELEKWKASEARARYLEDGMSITELKGRVSGKLDDGSLGGWLPADPKVLAQKIVAPPRWKNVSTVMLGIYPTGYTIKVFILPGLACAVPAMATAPEELLFWLHQLLQVSAMTYIMLPVSQKFTTALGWNTPFESWQEGAKSGTAMLAVGTLTVWGSLQLGWWPA